jgi:hypothetical protein
MAISLRNYLEAHVGRRAFVRDWAPNLFWPCIISLLVAALAVKVGKPAILAFSPRWHYTGEHSRYPRGDRVLTLRPDLLRETQYGPNELDGE